MSILKLMRDRQMYKYGQSVKKFDMQGGVRNYLGEQETVSDVPVKWQSGPNHPTTELAYITEAEKNLLLNQDLHNSLDGGPNRGPEGLMSLNGWGDANDGFGNGQSGADSGGNYGGDSSYNANETYITTEMGTPAIGPASWNNDTVRTTVSPKTPQDTYGQKYTGGGFFNRVLGGANKYGYTDTIGGLGSNKNDTKPGYGGRIMGGLLGLATGIPFIGGAIGSAYDKGKRLFGPKEKDMSGYNNLGLGGTGQYGFGVPTQQGDYDMLGNKINEITGEITSPTGQSLGTIPGYPGGGIATIQKTNLPNGGSDQYVNLIDQYVPEVSNDEFLQRFKVKDDFRKAKGDDLIAEDKKIAKMISKLYT